VIVIEPLSGNALRIVAPEKLKADDFLKIAPQVEALIRQHGKVRLLIDASGFHGWESVAAFENHAGFVKTHHQKVARIAFIVAHDWQRWLIGALRIFLHPKVESFDTSQEDKARQWIVGPP
jgi:hypothetical protein